MEPDNPPLISIVTTCKNRLSHLRVSLPAMMAQANSEVVVVDYGCEQGTAGWVRSHHSAAKVVEVTDDLSFCNSRARNLGAAEARGKLFLFCDADVVLDTSLGEWIAQHADERCFYMAAQSADRNLLGTCICPAAAFKTLGGYDEAFRGWGGEDRDLYERLIFAGVQRKDFPNGLAQSIDHADDIRQFGPGSGGMDNKPQSIRVNDLYRAIKLDVARLGLGNLDLNARKAIMEEIRVKLIAFDGSGREQDGKIEIRLALDHDRNKRVRFERKLVYQLMR